MDPGTFLAVFGTLPIAEPGDRTQLATMLFATHKEVSKVVVFLASSLALAATSAIGVLAGSLLSGFSRGKVLSYIAGTGFFGIGIHMLCRAWGGWPMSVYDQHS